MSKERHTKYGEGSLRHCWRGVRTACSVSHHRGDWRTLTAEQSSPIFKVLCAASDVLTTPTDAHDDGVQGFRNKNAPAVVVFLYF